MPPEQPKISDFESAGVTGDPSADSTTWANRESAGALADAGVDHHCRICPTCGNQLTGHRCKLICTQCGYYLSCADYY